jgi:hypothetical protein
VVREHDRLLLAGEYLQEEQEDVQDVEEDRRGQQGAELMSREQRIRWKSSRVKPAKMTSPSSLGTSDVMTISYRTRRTW